jgi:hypothetical protein
LRQRWIRHRCRSDLARVRSIAPTRPAAPSEMTSRGGLQADRDRLAGGGDAPGREHRLGPGAVVRLEVRTVAEQLVQLHPVQAPLASGGELLGDRLADPRDGRLRQRRLQT